MPKDYFWNTLGVLLQNAISPLLIILVARINGIDDVGVFSFAFSIAIVFWTIAMWGGRTYQISDTNGKFSAQGYILVRVVISIPVLISAVIFCVVNGYDISKSVIIVTLVILKTIESISDSIYGVIQSNGRLYIAGKSLALKSVVSMMLFLIADVVFGGVLYGCLALVVANLVVIIFYDIPQSQRLQKLNAEGVRWRKYIPQAMAIIKKSWMLCAVSFLSALPLNIPRYFLDHSNPGQIGYFGIIAMPVTLVVLLVTFILQPNIVSLAKKFNKGDHSEFNLIIKKILQVTLLVGSITATTVYFAGVPALNFIFSMDFTEYKIALVIITIGAIANAIVAVFINILTVMRELRVQFLIFLISNIALVFVSFLFFREIDIVGSVIIFAVVSLAQAGMFWTSYIKKMQS